MADSQLFNLAIPAPVPDDRPFFGDGVDLPLRKYCTHGLRVPLQIESTATKMKTHQIRSI